MVVRVERVATVPAAPEEVWEFIADPERRARPISVVKDFELLDENRAVWHVSLPVPLVDKTITIETRERTKRPPEYVEFVGNSKVLKVVGEHELVERNGSTELTNRFTVDGKVPGVERFFKKRMDEEFDNIDNALREFLGIAQ